MIRAPPARDTRVGARPERACPHHDRRGGVERKRARRARPGDLGGRRPAPRQAGEQHEKECRDAGKEKVLLRRHGTRRPEPQQRRSVSERGGGRAEADHLVRHPSQAERGVDATVLEERRHQRHRGGDPHDDNRHAIAPPRAPVDEPQQPQSDQHRQEQQEIAVRGCLEEPGRGEQNQPAPAPARDIPVQRQEDRRHPLRRNHLKVPELSGAIGRCRERDAADDRRRHRAGQAQHQQPREPSRERVRQQQADVVGGERRAAEELNGGRDRNESGEVLGQRQGTGHRDQDRRVPPGRGEGHGLRVPPQDPGIEQRIAEVVRHPRRQMRRERPGPGDSQRDEGAEWPRGAAEGHATRGCQMADAGWPMADGRRKMADGR